MLSVALVPTWAGVGLVVLDLVWRDPGGMPLGWSIVGAAIVGVGFGLVMAAYYRKKARGLGLPRWEDYPQTGVGVYSLGKDGILGSFPGASKK